MPLYLFYSKIEPTRLSHMKTDTSHIPKAKLKELTRLVELVQQHFTPHMIILYGSYARGDYVDIEREYQSDFDILIVCGSRQKKNINRINAIEEEIRLDDTIQTMVHIQYECSTTINSEIKKYNYLFVDIVREGVILFDNKDVELAEVKDLEPKERYEKAKRDYKRWMESSEALFHIYQDDIKSKDNRRLNWAAFHLHQRVEHLFMALLLVYTGYKPKTHDLNDLIAHGVEIDNDIKTFFPKNNNTESHLYSLLQKAYVDARYDMNFIISESELSILEGWTTNFETHIQQLCEQKLAELKQGVSRI